VASRLLCRAMASALAVFVFCFVSASSSASSFQMIGVRGVEVVSCSPSWNICLNWSSVIGVLSVATLMISFGISLLASRYCCCFAIRICCLAFAIWCAICFGSFSWSMVTWFVVPASLRVICRVWWFSRYSIVWCWVICRGKTE